MLLLTSAPPTANPTAIPLAAEVHFTSLSSSSVAYLSSISASSTSATTGTKAGFHTIPIKELMKERGVSMDRVCLLDPKATEELCPEDAGNFDWFLFGG